MTCFPTDDNSVISNKKVCIISTIWHRDNLDKVVTEIANQLNTAGVSTNELLVPGCFEFLSLIPKIQNNYDLIICIGALLKGETDHYENISSAVTQGLTQIALDPEYPIINGIFNCLVNDQIIEKCDCHNGVANSLAKSCLYMLIDNFERHT